MTLGPEEMLGSTLTVSVQEAQGTAVVHVDGEIDASSVDTLRTELDTLVDDGHSRVVLDLRNVSFMDSSGLAALLTTRRRVQSLGGGAAVVCAESGVVRHVLELTGLDKVMPIFATPEEAIVGEFAG